MITLPLGRKTSERGRQEDSPEYRERKKGDHGTKNDQRVGWEPAIGKVTNRWKRGESGCRIQKKRMPSGGEQRKGKVMKSYEGGTPSKL